MSFIISIHKGKVNSVRAYDCPLRRQSFGSISIEMFSITVSMTILKPFVMVSIKIVFARSTTSGVIGILFCSATAQHRSSNNGALNDSAS